jgi:predicted phosphodiesterase
VKLYALSDLHLGHAANRDALERAGQYSDDWLILAGDVGERPAHLELALRHLAPRFARLVWVPGNHDLWGAPGQQRYDELVAICRAHGVLTPEDPYAAWPGDAATFVVPMFLLYDYSFRPPDVPAERAIAWARASGIGCGDEHLLDPAPWPSRPAWCHARCAWTAERLAALPAGARTVLVNHWPLRYDLARPPRIPRFSIWCGTEMTDPWGRRYRARVVVSGHLHLRTTLWRDGVRYEEVSLGYPRDWNASRGLDWYLRDVLSGDEGVLRRFAPSRDPFV